jgi:hypothetical protein
MLLERKRRLRALLHKAPDRLVYVEHMKGDSRRIVEHACKLGLEGIVSKQARSPCRSRETAVCAPRLVWRPAPPSGHTFSRRAPWSL